LTCISKYLVQLQCAAGKGLGERRSGTLHQYDHAYSHNTAIQKVTLNEKSVATILI